MDDATRLTRTVREGYLTQEAETMHADQPKGKWMQFKGKLKQPYGKFTDDDLPPTKGSHNKFVGKARERYGDKNDEDMKWADQWRQRSQPEVATDKTRRGEVIKKIWIAE
jgi:uncharacterized protein YjbJ (UPF0337 family)